MKLAYNTLEFGPTPDLARMLGEIKQTGWDGWEVRQSLDWLGSAERVAAISSDAGLPVAGVCGQGWDFDDDPVVFEINCRRIEFAADVGADAFVIMAPDRPENRPPSTDEVDRFAAAAEALWKFGADSGTTVVFHFHTGQLVQTEREIRQVLDAAPELKLCIDVSHAQLIGWDACECLREFAERLAYVHLQDYRGWRYVNVGAGDLFPSIPAIFDTLDDIQFDGWVVCHGGRLVDQPPRERARISREYLRGMGR